MPRATSLSNEEQAQILVLDRLNLSQNAIAKQLNRSRAVVQNFLKNPVGYKTKKRPGAPPKLSAIAKRNLVRQANKGNSSASELRTSLNLDVSVRRVQQVLHDTPHLQYKKMKCAPALTVRHKQDRIKWATAHVTWRPCDWDSVVFSDEKKFNLDGPDGFAYYWHDIRKEERIFSKRQGGGKSLMIWAAFSQKGKSDIAILDGRQNAQKYTETLQSHLIPFTARNYNSSWIFQQDNASIHTARLTKSWFQEKNIQVMEWPAKSPDLNPIENVWGVLARRVYANARQFSTVQELKARVVLEWSEIGPDLLNTLVLSMQKRCIDVLSKQGSKVDY